MKLKIIVGFALLLLLGGCNDVEESDAHTNITTPNGLSFSIVDAGVSYEDFILFKDTHLYAIRVRPGYNYHVFLDSVTGDSDLYLYYDYQLSGQSLLAYSELPGSVTDSNVFLSDFNGIIYVEVYGVIDSQYLITVTESVI